MQSEAIIAAIDKLAEKFGIAIDWTSSNIVPCVQEIANKYVAMKITSSYVWLGIGIACIIAALVFLLMSNRQSKSFDNYSQQCRQAEKENADAEKEDADDENLEMLCRKRDDAKEIGFWYYFAAVLFGIGGVVIIIPTIFTLVKYYMAPEIQVIEYIRHFVRWGTIG